MVEWKKLGEVCVIRNGYTPSTKENSYWENGTLPWFTLEDIRKNGRILEDAIKHITSLGVKKGGLFPKDSIIVSTTATIGEYALIKSDFLCNQQITCLTIKTDLKEQLLPKYLYYLTDRIGKWCKKNVNGGGSLLIVSTSKLNNFLIPIPSLAEQNRIVGILDTFTASIDNLKEQIALRRKQYEYYRDQLLDLEGKEGVEMKMLGDVLKSIKTGLNPRKNFVLNSPGSKNYYITVRELGLYNIIPVEKTDRVTDEALTLINNRSNLEIGDVLFSGTGTIGRTALVKEKPTNWNIKEGVYTLKPKSDIIESCYLIQLLHCKHVIDKISSLIVGDPIKSVPMKNFVIVSIPVPSLQEQQRIVSILDTFEASIQNFEDQLSQREKQYEYYRNKLLTFE